MKTKESQIRKICILITGSSCVLALIAVVFELFDKKGNHGILFGSWLDRMLFQYPQWVALLFSLPMLIPFVFNRSLKNIKLIALGVLSFVLLYVCFVFLTD